MLKALLFDLDGTLIETEPLHFAAHQRALAPYGITFTLEEYLRYGMSIDRHVFYEKMQEIRGVPVDVKRAGQEKKKYYLDTVHNATLFPGTEEVLQQVVSRYACYIVSSSDKETIKHLLDQTGISKYFQKVYSTKDAARPKPYPDVYVDVLADLHLSAQETVVIEDSVQGVEAAHAAGIRCIAIPNDFTKDEDFSLATIKIENIKQLPETIAGIVDYN